MLLLQVEPPPAFPRAAFTPSPPPAAAVSWLVSLSPDRLTLSDSIIALGTAAAVVVLGLRLRNVMTRLRQAHDDTLRPPMESEVEMAEGHDAVDEAVIFEETSSGRETRRARAIAEGCDAVDEAVIFGKASSGGEARWARSKLPSRAARDGPPRRPRQGARSHRRLEEEDDEPPARRTVPNRRRASSSGVSAADTSRRAPNHSRTSPAQDDGEPAEAKMAPEAGLAQSPPSPVPPTHYEVLGVGRDASNTDVKRAFFRLSRLYHPDKNVGREGDADDKFIQVRQAYETLSDLALRLDYDYELSCS